LPEGVPILRCSVKVSWQRPIGECVDCGRSQILWSLELTTRSSCSAWDGAVAQASGFDLFRWFAARCPMSFSSTLASLLRFLVDQDGNGLPLECLLC
jgi:hypothetical protein